MSNKNCEHEDDTVKYFSGQLDQKDIVRVEEHIAKCPQCCQTIAELTKAMFSKETPEEKAFLDSYSIDSQLEIRKLIKKSLETNASTDSNVVSFSEKTIQKSFFSYLKAPYIALAAALAFVVLFGGVIFLTLHKSSSTPLNSNPEIAQSISNLREINIQGRPTIFRLEGFDYAQPAKGRGLDQATIKEQLKKIENKLKTELQTNPTSENLNLLAQSFIMSEKYNEAIEALEKALLLNPNDPALLTNLAVSYAAKPDYQNALIAINKALRINENYLAAIFNRALIYQELKQYDGARSDWEKYLKLDPTSRWSAEAKENLSNIP